MSRTIAVSQRVDIVPARGERRDALDQRWTGFLAACGLSLQPMPNGPGCARALLDELKPAGVLLTGGNDLAAYGGDAPERDATEAVLIEWARGAGRPLVAVCRGLQMLMHHFGVTLVPLEGHAGTRHSVSSDAGFDEVNSYHNWGFREVPAGFRAWAHAPDGTIEAVRHQSAPIVGIMWHPEREAPFRRSDIALMRDLFAVAQ